MGYKGFDQATAYSQMVADCVREWALAVVGELTIKEFAEMCGFSITHNLRRRVKNMVDFGVINARYRQDENGRWVMKYEPSESYRQALRQEKLPF